MLADLLDFLVKLAVLVLLDDQHVDNLFVNLLFALFSVSSCEAFDVKFGYFGDAGFFIRILRLVEFQVDAFDRLGTSDGFPDVRVEVEFLARFYMAYKGRGFGGIGYL